MKEQDMYLHIRGEIISLMFAHRVGRFNIVRAMQPRAGYINAQSLIGDIPLMLAATAGQGRIVQPLPDCAFVKQVGRSVSPAGADASPEVFNGMFYLPLQRGGRWITSGSLSHN